MRLGPQKTRWLAAGGVVGPAAFVTSWAVLGATAEGYSPVTDAISELARWDSPTRGWMTAGLAAFGAGVAVHALAVRDALEGGTWALLLSGAASTVAVAALPLGLSEPVDALHGVAAVAAYATLAAAPIAAAEPLRRRGRRLAATVSALAGTTATLLLIASITPPAGGRDGLLQRAGLTVADAWIVASGIAVATGRWRSVDPLTPRLAPGTRRIRRVPGAK